MKKAHLIIGGLLSATVIVAVLFTMYEKKPDKVGLCWGQEYLYPPITNTKVVDGKRLVESRRPTFEIQNDGALVLGCTEEGASVLVDGSPVVFSENNRQFFIQAARDRTVILKLEKDGRKREIHLNLEEQAQEEAPMSTIQAI